MKTRFFAQGRKYIFLLGIVCPLSLNAQQTMRSLWQEQAICVQENDARTKSYLAPRRIVWKSSEEPGIILNETCLLKGGIGQGTLNPQTVCKMKRENGKTSAMLLDFGTELQGGIQIVTGQSSTQKPIRVRLRFGESAGEAMCDIDGRNGATNDHAVRDQTVGLPWLGTAEVGNSGFRFVRIDLLDDNVELSLKEIRATATYRDIPYLGSFVSDDERLNRIWQVGAYTVHLNMQEYLWDGVKRDRLVWVGDLHPEVMTISSVFGYNEVVPKSLDLIRNETPLPGWMNGISSYSIWWLLIQRDWYYYHGDKAYLTQQKDYLTGLLKILIGKVDAGGKEHLDGMRFLDWPSNANPQAIDTGLHALMVMGMKAGYELCTLLGEEELAKKCNDTRRRLLDARKDLNLPAPYSVQTGSKQAAALMALSGLTDAKEASEKWLKVEGSAGFSTFYGYYMLKALAQGGAYAEALGIIREYWGGMIDLGATTFWEDFDIRWMKNAARIDELPQKGQTDIHKAYGNYCYKGYRHSLCHGWASGPTAWLSQYVLGVQVEEPGCKTVRITPHLGDLKRVKGTFPTPYGIIRISHEVEENGKIKTVVEAPPQVKIVK